MVHITKDNGRLHIANGVDYQGSVKKYDNPIVKLITKLFNYSTEITINETKVCVKNKSYLKLLKQLGVVDSSAPEGTSVKEYKNFDRLTCTYLKNRGLMRQHISTGKSDKLGRECIKAFINKDMQGAAELMGRGANINMFFWQREKYGLTFRKGYYEVLTNDGDLEAIKTTPFLYAAITKNDQLMGLLQKYRANEGFVAKKGIIRKNGWEIKEKFHYDSSTKSIIKTRVHPTKLVEVQTNNWDIPS